MKSRLLSTPWVKTALRLLATASLVLLAVQVVISSTREPGPVPSVQSGAEQGAGMTGSPQLVSQGADAGDYYLYQGRRVPLHRSRDEIGVRFHTTGREKVRADLRTLAPQAVLDQAGDPGTQGVSIVRLPSLAASDKTNVAAPQASSQELDQTRLTLNASADVEFAFPVFINPVSGIRILVTDEVVAKLRPGTNPAAVAKAFSLKVVGPLWKTSDEYVFRLGDPKGTDPLAVANTITQSGLVEWAEPNFIQEYQKPATPNDPLFPSQWHLNNTGQGGGTPGALMRISRARGTSPPEPRPSSSRSSMTASSAPTKISRRTSSPTPARSQGTGSTTTATAISTT